MIESIEQTLRASPWIGLLLVAALAWLEYVLPPVPGDSTMLLACFLAGAGVLPLPAVVAACLAGSVAGALTAWDCGRRLGSRYFFLRSGWARREIARLEGAFARHGARLLAVNRFLPGIRALFLYAAGMARLPARQVLAYSTVSNILWVALIAWAGGSLGASWDDVQRVFRGYVWGVAGVVAVYIVWSVVRRGRGALSGSGGGVPRSG